MSDCDFCKVMEELFLYETTHSKVIFNYLQVDTTYAIVVVPKRHVTTVLDLNKEEYVDLCLTVWDVHKKLSETGIIDCESCNYLLNEGPESGKTVDHVHYHFLTRKKNDKIQNMARPTKEKFNADRVEEIKKILL